MRIHIALLVSSFVGVFASASPSFAQPSPSAPAKSEGDALTQKARQLYAEGVKAYQQAKWEEARASFLAAWALAKHYTIAGNLADCEMRLGLYRDAAEHLAYYVREVVKDDTTTTDERKNGQRHYDEARAKVASVIIHVNVPGAELYVDGKSIGKAPLLDALFLDTGSHVLEARSEGYLSAKSTVDAKAGTSRDVALELKRADVVPPVPPPSVGPSPVWIAVSGALAAGGFGAGIGLTAAANGKSADAKTLRAQVGSGSGCFAQSISQPCVMLQSAADSKNTLSNLALVSFIAGGAFALTSAGLGVWSASSPKTGATVRVAPVVGASQGGVLVVGSW
ncbi:MAG: PEGA domain-containing protein [Byssovorax sp.]